MSRHDRNHDADPDTPEPLNRAERRAQRRGRKNTPPPGGERVQSPGHRDAVLVPRRSGRRGNR
jgi:hypothetical protein